jgi:DNA-binding SARP family transcriptional activator/tetratricopeptide (TPR) repeat protein
MGSVSMVVSRPDKTLEFLILGPLEVRRSGEPLDLGAPKQRALLADLLLHANKVLPVERLIDDLWGEDPPQTAANALQVYVSHLRKILEPSPSGLLITREPGYVAHVSEDQLDRGRFERLVVEGREAILADQLELAAELLRDGLDLWRGPGLAELPLHFSARAEIERLQQLRLAAHEDLIVVELALGRHPDLLPELEVLVGENPYRESLRGHLMLALYRSGRQADALDVYRQTRETLVENLGIDPSGELQRLEQAILRQDPALELEPRPERPDSPKGLPQQPETRKTVTVAALDLFIEPGANVELDPELVSHVTARSFEAVSRSVERHRGLPYRLLDARAIAVFGAPSVHEDDTLRAVRALIEAREALAELSVELDSELGVRLAMRAGIEAGVALVGRGRSAELVVTGNVITAAERASESAEQGEILIGSAAHLLLSGAVRVQPVAAGREQRLWRLLEVVPGASALARRHDAPLVGRTDELAELRHGLERAARERRCLLVTVLGEAGIGKSRLALELRAQHEGELTVISGACRSYGEGVTFSPIADLVEELVGDGDLRSGIAAHLAGDSEAEAIASVIDGAIGLGEPPGTEELFRAVRRLLEALARERTLIVVLEDIHWAEPTFLDLVEHIAEWSRQAPILLLCLARQELLEERPSWGGGKVNAITLSLEPLSRAESIVLIEQHLGGRGLSTDAQARIASFAGGNPFFVEQLLAMVAQEPRFADDLSSPPSVQALLGARLDRLSPEERALLDHASVLGVEFAWDALAELLPDEIADTGPAGLHRLAHKGLVRPLDLGIKDPGTWTFAHALIREAAYDSLSKRRRAALHAQLAEWFEGATRQKLPEVDELAGYHLEQAYTYRRELGEADEAARSLAERGAARLAAAGRRAYATGDMPAAVSLLTRATRLLAPEHSDRPELLADLGEALRDAGELDLADLTLIEAIETADRTGDDIAGAHALVVRWQLRLQTDPQVSFDEAVSAIGATIDRLHELGQQRGLAKAWLTLAEIPWLRGQAAASEQALERGLAYARTVGDRRAEAQSLNALSGVALLGPMPVDQAIRRCEDVLEEASGEGRVAASALRALAGLNAMEGRFEEAWEYLDRDRAILHDLGLKIVASSSAEVGGFVGLLAGDPGRAESELRWGYELIDEMGDRNALSTVAAHLAQAVLLQGRNDEALALTELSEEAGAPDDLTVQVLWRGPRASVLAQNAELDRAEQLAREAVELAERTDFLNLHADALMGLAEVLHVAGRPTDETTATALTLYERKGNLISAARVRAAVEAASPAPA